jgi:hypothetical protein
MTTIARHSFKCYWAARVLQTSGNPQPANAAAIPVDKAESRGTTNWIAGSITSRANKGVGPSVDGNVTIDANPLFTKDTL